MYASKSDASLDDRSLTQISRIPFLTSIFSSSKESPTHSKRSTGEGEPFWQSDIPTEQQQSLFNIFQHGVGETGEF